MNARASRKVVRAVGAATLLAVALAAHLAGSDAVLNPGTITGTVGLGSLTVSGGFASASGSNGFFGQTSFTGTTFSLTVESGQTYGSMFVREDVATGGFVDLSRSSATAVPAGGTVAVDLTRPAGSLAVHVAATGATVTRSALTASASDPGLSEFYQGNASGAADVSVPMVAAASVTLGGTIDATVTDDAGSAVCTATRSVSGIQTTVAAGATTAVEVPVSFSLADCGTAVAGRIALAGLPADVSGQFSVFASGPVFKQQSSSANPFDYDLSGLPAGHYSVFAQSSLGGPGLSSFLQFPGSPAVDLAAGQSATKDFAFDAVLASGTVSGVGPAPGALASANVRLTGAFDPAQPGGGPTSGGVALGFAAPSAYQAVLTPGTWNVSAASLSFSDFSAAAPWQAGVTVFDGSFPVVQAVPGAPLSIPDVQIPLSRAQMVFDVVEPPGAPTIGISNPSINGFATLGPGRSSSLFGQAFVANAATPVVEIVGPPGSYAVNAFATVNGAFTRFASTTVDLGTLVNTPSGANVTVQTSDSTGAPLPVSLDFENVVSPGVTTASVTDVGPAPPVDTFLLKWAKDHEFLDVATTATFAGKVLLAIHYDPAALGLKGSQESKLQLQHYVCPTPSTCAWQVINETYTPGPTFFGRSSPPFTNPDTTNHVIYGVTSSFSLFALTVPSVNVVPPTDTCVGDATAPAQLTSDPDVCTATVDDVNKRAGGCGDAGGGLASCTFDGAASEALSLGRHDVQVVATGLDGATSTCTSRVDVVDRQGPTVTCPPAASVECTGATTPVPLAATCADNCGTCAASCGSTPYPLGKTPVACNATDAAGNASACETAVTVVDTRAPDVAVTASPAVLWPPDHRLVPIVLDKRATDVCDPAPKITCEATSSEPPLGGGSGATNPDIVWTDGQLALRAERSGTGPGRTYTVTCTATDASGNHATATAKVTVPHDAPPN
jgi:hypothetical protein